MTERPAVFRRYIVPTVLWTGAMIAFPLVHYLPDSVDLPALLACLGSHTLGGCWMLYSLRGRRDLLGWRILVGLPATASLAISLWAMRTDDMQFASVLVTGVIAVILWLMFAAMRLPPPAE